MDKLNQEQQYSLNDRRELMRRLIRVAIENAIPVDEYDQMSEEQQQHLSHATAHATNLQDYRIFMEELGLKEAEIKDIVVHEYAHADKANELGATFEGYQILLLKDENGWIIPAPRVKISYPEDWSHEKYVAVLKEITTAPEEYGNKLSPDDINDLKKTRPNK